MSLFYTEPPPPPLFFNLDFCPSLFIQLVVLYATISRIYIYFMNKKILSDLSIVNLFYPIFIELAIFIFIITGNYKSAD